ncbi:hypothetical protein CDD82_2494 [Ophiocordyceps australis]|uniref:Cytochrome P450 n=1 Tax=Ophiocordyceps australis TaxID=1399860 RepID=A0A2C5ZHJ9_9HYPO|nr:hypothetical protein CDD82_2494 [Ophiocordyceps australis]
MSGSEAPPSVHMRGNATDQRILTYQIYQGGVLAAVFYLVCKTVLLLKRRATARQAGVQKIPWLKQNPFIRGLDTALEIFGAIRDDRLHQLLQTYVDQAGNTFGFYCFGPALYFTVEPENVKTIVATDFHHWVNGGRKCSGLKPLLGMGIFTTDGAAWKRSRTMLRPSFDRNNVADMDCFESHLQHMLKLIPDQGKTVDLSALFFRLTLDSSTELLLGQSVSSLSDPGSTKFLAAFDRAQLRCFVYLVFGDAWRRLTWGKDARQDRKIVYDFVDGVIDRYFLSTASEKQASNGTFLSQLVQQTHERESIRSEVVNILVAGRDTTASLLSNLWLVLSTRPDVWRKLQAEVQTLEGRHPDAEQIRELRYVRALIKEALRLFPPVPFELREACEDSILPRGGGSDGAAPIYVKAGSIMIWSLYGMHRRKDVFGHDADEFRPERWLDDEETGEKGLRPSWAYVPFHGGPRICMGQHLATNQAIYTTVRLCQEFEAIECRGPREYQAQISLVMRNRHGAKVGLWQRASST